MKNNKPKSKRLTRKQKSFLINVLLAGRTIDQAMDELKIWPRLLHTWLQQPHFLEAIEIRLAQYHLQARIEAAKAAGMYCIAIETSLERKHLQAADCILKNIGEVIENPVLSGNAS